MRFQNHRTSVRLELTVGTHQAAIWTSAFKQVYFHHTRKTAQILSERISSWWGYRGHIRLRSPPALGCRVGTCTNFTHTLYTDVPGQHVQSHSSSVRIGMDSKCLPEEITSNGTDQTFGFRILALQWAQHWGEEDRSCNLWCLPDRTAVAGTRLMGIHPTQLRALQIFTSIPKNRLLNVWGTGRECGRDGAGAEGGEVDGRERGFGRRRGETGWEGGRVRQWTLIFRIESVTPFAIEISLRNVWPRIWAGAREATLVDFSSPAPLLGPLQPTQEILARQSQHIKSQITSFATAHPNTLRHSKAAAIARRHVFPIHC